MASRTAWPRSGNTGTANGGGKGLDQDAEDSKGLVGKDDAATVGPGQIARPKVQLEPAKTRSFAANHPLRHN